MKPGDDGRRCTAALRPVAAVLAAAGFSLLRLAVFEFTEHLLDWPARNELDYRESQREHPEQGRNHHQQPFCKVNPHGYSFHQVEMTHSCGV